MVGNSLEEGLLLQNTNLRHTGAAFPAVMMVGTVWMACLITFNLVDYAPVPGWLVLVFSVCLGLAAGLFTGRFLKRLSERRRERLAAEYRADQESETARKLEEARKAGII